MARALSLRLLTIAAVSLALCLIPESSFAQHGGGHGGGGGFHGGGGGFHGGGGFGGGNFHGGGGGFHGGAFGGGFNGNGFRGGFGGNGFRGGFGRGWGGHGWGGSGWGWGGRGSGWGGWGWGWGLGLNWGLGWGWPWWYGDPYYGSWGPYAYGCPYDGYSYYGYCGPYYSPGYGQGYVDPPGNGPGAYPPGNGPYRNQPYPWGNNSEPDWRHEPGPSQQPNNAQPEQSQPKPSYSPNSTSSPDSKLIIVNYVTRPAPAARTPRADQWHPQLARAASRQTLPNVSPRVRNAILLLRTMPPAARERWLAAGHYNEFSPQERELLRKYTGADAVKLNVN